VDLAVKELRVVRLSFFGQRNSKKRGALSYGAPKSEDRGKNVRPGTGSFEKLQIPPAAPETACRADERVSGREILAEWKNARSQEDHIA